MPLQLNPDVLASLTDEQRFELDVELLGIDEITTENPLVKYNNPFFGPVHHKQLAFNKDKTRLRAFLGGNRSAKSTGGLVDDIIQAVDREVVPEHLQDIKRWEPPFRCRIMAPDFKFTIEVVILEILKDWIPPSQLLDGNWRSAYDSKSSILRFANGSFFQLMSYEQDTNKFGGSSLHRNHFDEEPPRRIYKECRKRLIDTKGDTILTMTPETGFTDVMAEVWERRHEDNISVRKISMDDNPWISKEEIEEFVRDLTPEEERAYRHGDIVHFAGLVFDKYWSEELVTEEILSPTLRGQSVVVGIDPGIRYTGLVWVAFDDDNCALVFDSLKLQDHSVDMVVEQIRAKNEEWGLEPDYYVIDPTARNRNAVNAEAIEAEYERFEIYTVHGQNDVPAGVAQMQRRMHLKQLLFTENNVDLFWEIEHYRRDPKVKEKFAVIKEHDHILDALRYALMSRPHIGPSGLTGQEPTGFTPKSPDGMFIPRGAQRPLHPLGDLV